MSFVGEVVARHNLRHASVLEIGSLNVNGSVRGLFDGPYLGIDMQDGPGVDLVMNAHALVSTPLDGEPFEVIVCTEMLEHDDLPWVTLENAYEHADAGAWLILTCRGYDERGCFPLHGHPDDIYRFSCAGIRSLLRATGWQAEVVGRDPTDPGVFAVAQKV